MRGADSEYRWFSLRARAERDTDGRVIRWYGLLTDIDGLKRAQAVLRAGEQRLREMIDGIPGFIYTMAPTGEPEFFNRPFLDYLGRTAEEMMDWARIGVIHPDDLARSMAVWRRAVETGQDYSLELRLRRADGVFRWFELRSRTVRDASGRIVRSYGMQTDIDDRKRAERRLRRAMRARYEAVLAERMRIAREMHDGLLQDVAGIALQLGAVLPHIPTSPEASVERLGHILTSVQRASREAREAVAGMRAQPDTADVVSAVQSEAQRLTTRAALSLSVTVSGLVRRVPAAMSDVAQSLVREGVTNIVKHASAHSVKLTVRFGSRRLAVSLSDDGGGLTMPDADRDQASHFGLAGMRERAASVGGTLRLSSVPGKGTTVALNIPLHTDG
jgi:PAS domain S-box-containing protein